MTPRRQRALVAVIAVIGLLRGTWWVVTTPLWSPIDEQAHYDYVQALGRLEGIPVVGEDRVHRDVLEVAKHSSTSAWQSVPIPPDPGRTEWHALAHSYEAAQPPLYYAALAPVWKLADGARTVATVYVLRVASLLLSLALVPLVWLLGRELFGDESPIGVGAAAVLVTLSGVNGNFAIVANDGLMTVLCAGALLVTARAIRRGPTTRRAVLVGALVGAAVLTKLTAISVGLVVAAAVLLMRRAGRLRFAATAAGVSGLVVAPWVLFNVVTYGGLTASQELDAITGSLQSDPPLNLSGLATRLRQAGHGFWDAQLLNTTVSRAAWVWFVVAAAIGVLAFVRRRDDRGVLAWLYSAWPLAFATMAFVILGLSGGRSDIAGRHLYVALPALVVGVVAALAFIAGRWTPAALALVCAVTLTFEARDAPGVMRAIYTDGAFANLAPVVDRSYADRLVAGGNIVIDSPCPVVALRFVFQDAAPQIALNGTLVAPSPPAVGPGRAVAALYDAAERPTRLTVDIGSDARVAASRAGPAFQVLCVVADNEDARFAQNFRRGHLPLTYAQVAFVPRAWAAVAWLAAACAVARNIRRWGRRGDGSSGSRSSSEAAS